MLADGVGRKPPNECGQKGNQMAARAHVAEAYVRRPVIRHTVLTNNSKVCMLGPARPCYALDPPLLHRQTRCYCCESLRGLPCCILYQLCRRSTADGRTSLAVEFDSVERAHTRTRTCSRTRTRTHTHIHFSPGFVEAASVWRLLPSFSRCSIPLGANWMMRVMKRDEAGSWQNQPRRAPCFNRVEEQFATVVRLGEGCS